MIHHMRASAIALLTALAVPAAWAETPPDTLVQAWAIDDVITLDPAEVFEFTASEVLGNSYQGLVTYDVEDVTDIQGEIAESWEVSEDGRTFTFTIRPGLQFASGNPITAADPVYSLQRAVKLNSRPPSSSRSSGSRPRTWTRWCARRRHDFELEMDRAYAPTLLLYCLTATVGFVVDSQLIMENEQDGDFGQPG
jgi:peptide/nickel transport system substrate-binding protein